VWTRFLSTSWVVGFATLGPVGRIRHAPGTAGAFFGVIYAAIFFSQLTWWMTLLLCMPPLYFAVAICGEAELRLGMRDPGMVVLDEFVVMPICYLGWQYLPPYYINEVRWAVYLTGFALFRLYDITKPFGVSKLQRLPGGWGVVVDDFAAALLTCVSLHFIGAILNVVKVK
jgi:phosphatidylglycerophosphatase A